MINRILLALVLMLYGTVAGIAQDQWPSKPIRFIVPFAAGGISDIVSRNLGEALSKAVGQPVIIDNRSGAGGMIGTEAIVRSPPDGYTIGLVLSNHASNVAFRSKLSYDALRDITPITLIGYNNILLVVHPSVPANSVQELVALAKAKPGTLSYGSAGTGGMQHLAGEMLRLNAGIDIVHIPYRGAAAAMNDLIAGQLQMMFAGATVKPFLDSGQVKALAVSHSERSPYFPSLPTLVEAGVPNFGLTEWYGVMGPAGIPDHIVRRLDKELVRIINSPQMVEALKVPGIEVETKSRGEFRAFIEKEIERFSDLAKRSNIRLD